MNLLQRGWNERWRYGTGSGFEGGATAATASPAGAAAGVWNRREAADSLLANARRRLVDSDSDLDDLVHVVSTSHSQLALSLHAFHKLKNAVRLEPAHCVSSLCRPNSLLGVSAGQPAHRSLALRDSAPPSVLDRPACRSVSESAGRSPSLVLDRWVAVSLRLPCGGP